jgi:hypothetical protein
VFQLPPRRPREPITALDVVVIGSCLFMWAFFLWQLGAFRPLGW